MHQNNTIYFTFLMCMQGVLQIFCLDVRCAIPFSEDTPKLVTFLFFTVSSFLTYSLLVRVQCFMLLFCAIDVLQEPADVQVLQPSEPA